MAYKGKRTTRDADSISLSVHCPKCRRRMVLRKGPENYFYGCTGFPHDCRHTLTIAQAQGLHKHIQAKKSAHKGKTAQKAVNKRTDFRAVAWLAEAALHRRETKRQEVPSMNGGELSGGSRKREVITVAQTTWISQTRSNENV